MSKKHFSNIGPEATSQRNPAQRGFTEEEIKAAEDLMLRRIKRFKAKKSYNKVLGATNAQTYRPVDVIESSKRNFGALHERLRTREKHVHVEQDLFNKPLPDWMSTDIGFHANEIFNRHYLRQFSNSEGVQIRLRVANLRKQPEIQRETHGAMHASRVAAWVRVMASLYAKHGDVVAQNLTEEDLTLIQIAALFHDAARESDGEDIWDSASGELCYNYFREIGIDEERARFFSGAARHKDTVGIKSIAHKLIHDADCLDVMRMTYQFKIEELDFYQDIAKENPEALEELKKVVLEVRSYIASQNDLKHKDDKTAARIAISYEASSIIDGGEAVGVTFDLAEKKKYEHADNCFVAVTSKIADSERTSLLNELHSKEFARSKEPKKKDQDPNKTHPLSEQEIALLSRFQKSRFVLHHTCPLGVIDGLLAEETPALRDPMERRRWKDPYVPKDYGAFGGNRDNVFFGVAIGTAHFSTPDFTRSDDCVTVLFDVKELQTENPRALDGLWISDHFHHFNIECDSAKAEGENIVLGGTEFSWRHTTNRTAKEHSQEFLYRDETGTRLQREFLGDEVATGKELWPSISFRFIERLRLLGDDNPLRRRLLSEQVLKEPYDENLIAKVFEKMFRVDTFEMKLPGGIDLNQPGVTLLFTESPSAKQREKIAKKFPNIKVMSREVKCPHFF